MIYGEFISRLLQHPRELLEVYDDYLLKIQFRDVIVSDLVKEIIESWRLFGEVKIEYLKDTFKDRDDINLFMRKVAEETYEGDVRFNNWWMGKFLSEMLMEEIQSGDYGIDKSRNMIVTAGELRDISEGRVKPINVWDFVDNVEERMEKKEIHKILLKTGISLLDEQVEFADETVSIFVAPWKRYKSIILTNIGAVALAQGLSVFHVHYEGKKELWETRYDSCLSGIAINRLYSDMNEKEKEKLRKVYRKLKEKNLDLYFMGATPNTGAGYLEIKAELERLKKDGREFDLVVIDYLNLMKPSKKIAEDWKEQGELAWDLVRLSQDGYAVVSAIQAKMQSATREFLKENDLGRSAVIAQAVTNLIAINQNPTEKEQGCIRLSPLAVRGKEITKKNIPIEMVLWKMRMSREVDSILNKMVEDD